MTATAAAAAPGGRAELAWAWGVGLIAAVALVGPGLGPGAWMNVDLVVTDVTPVPRGVWGLGPELPRRVPFALPFAWLSALAPGELPWKLAVVAALASAVAGTWRLTARWDPTTGILTRAGVAVLAGIGPFAATRASVGHLGLTFALALLPWALPTLLRPAADRPRTALWALALGLCGPFGGTLALVTVGVALLADRSWRRDRRRGAARALAITVVAQGPWLAPTLVVASLGTDLSAAGDFPTDGGGAGGLLRLLAGHGFWLTPDQLGRSQGWEAPLLGLVVLGLAALGAARLPDELRRPAVAVGLVGLVGAAASGAPGLDRVADAVTSLPGGGIVREGQRLLALYLAVALPLAGLGAARVARRAGGAVGDMVSAAPVVIALVLVAPGLFGAAGSFDPVEIPPSWDEARARIEADPGPVLALPWSTYPRLDISDGRRVVNPLRLHLGGDVVVSSDPGFDDGRRERADLREPVAEDLAARMQDGEAVSAELRDLGVRWIVSIPVRGRTTDPVPDDPGLALRIDEPSLTLHEVLGWAPARSASGAPRPVDAVVAPWLRAPDEPLTVTAIPASGGWRRGGQAARLDGTGLSVGGGGALWYPWALAVGAADLAAVGLAALAWRRRPTRLDRAATSDDG